MDYLATNSRENSTSLQALSIGDGNFKNYDLVRKDESRLP